MAGPRKKNFLDINAYYIIIGLFCMVVGLGILALIQSSQIMKKEIKIVELQVGIRYKEQELERIKQVKKY